MKLIDADMLKKIFGIGGDEISCKNCKHLGRYGCIKEIPINYVCGFIDDAPTVDAVPVVRCKDCKYCSVNRYVDGNVYGYVCIEMDYGVNADDFCSRGKRRDENDH